MTKSKIDLSGFADVEELHGLLQPRLRDVGRLASAWERHLLSECLRMGVWRIWFVQWCEYRDNATFMKTKVFPAREIKKALALAKKVGEHVVGLSLKKWLLYTESAFNYHSGTSPNKDLMTEMRRVMRARCIAKCMPNLLRYKTQAVENATFKVENPEIFRGMEVEKAYWDAFNKIPHNEVAGE